MKEILFPNVEIDDILNRNVAAFLYSIRQSVMAGSKRIHLEKPKFPIFGIHNPEFYEQLNYENTLNWNICDHLINDILFDLFSLRERIDDKVKLLRFDKKAMTLDTQVYVIVILLLLHLFWRQKTKE